MGAENSNKMKKVPPASVAYTLLDFTEGEAGVEWSLGSGHMSLRSPIRKPLSNLVPESVNGTQAGKKTKFILWWDFPFSTAINWFVSKCEICQDLDLCWTRCETSQLEKFPFSLVSAVKYVQIRRAIKRCSLRLQDHKMFHRSGKVVGLLK